MSTKWPKSDEQERLGVYITGRMIATSGQIFREQSTNDVGIDAHVELVDEKSRDATGQLVALQIKGGPSYFYETTKDGVIFRGDLAHLDYWLNHSLPVFLVLVDTANQKAFWQEISLTVVERLEKGWKITVPFANDLAANFVAAARVQVGLDANAFSYTRLTLQDTSNIVFNTKRYASKLLMRPPVTRLRAEAVIRRATADMRRERYNLEGFKKHFGDRGADVVSLYVAGDPHDAENSNWYCRTLWVSNGLAAEAHPAKLGGIDLGDGLEVVWNADYAKSSQFYHGLHMDKQDFLTAVKEFTVNVSALVHEAFGEGLQVVRAPEDLQRHAAVMGELFIKSNDIGLPPYECKDVSERFGDIMALADNAFIYAIKALAEPADAGWSYLLETTLGNYHKNLDRLGYELEKVR